MKKCKWAGDPNDEYCKDCNGCELMFEGQNKIATDCAGYEEGTEEVDVETTNEVEEVPVETKKEVDINPPIDQDETPVKEDTKTKDKEKSTIKKETKKELPVIKENTSTTTEVDNELTRIKSVKIMSGVTREINGTYYKFTYEQENEVSPLATSEDIESIKEQMWAVANTEVDKQLADVLDN